MRTYATWDDLLEESEAGLIELARYKDYNTQVMNWMIDIFNIALSSGDLDSIFSICPYFEDSESYPNFHPTANARKLYMAARILRIEKTLQIPFSFLSSVTSYEEYIYQLHKTVFAMRRIELALSQPLVEDAIDYLNSIPFNACAAVVIFLNELFENYDTFSHAIIEYMKNKWSFSEKLCWLKSLYNSSPSTSLLIDLASIYMEQNCFSEACNYLSMIINPSDEITALITSLKGLINNG